MYKIGLDAGHGMNTPGKRTPDGIHEWELNDKVRDKVVQYLKGYNVQFVFTDNDEGSIDESLASRVDKYMKANVDVFVSIHHNAYNGKWNDATGVEVYTDKNPTQKDIELAEAIYKNLPSYTGLKGRGIKRENWWVINQNRIPAVLCEGGFMDSNNDYKVITSEQGQDGYAKAVAEGLIAFLQLKKTDGDVTPVKPEPTPTEPDYTGTITYQAYTTSWLPEVNKCDNTPDGYAGIGKEPITGFRCRPQYGELIYEARQLSNHQWLGAVNSKDYNKNDGSSYAGLYGRKIDGIRIKSTRGYVDYRVKTIEDGWLPWCRGWGETGNLYAGIKGHTIIGIQMK